MISAPSRRTAGANTDATKGSKYYKIRKYAVDDTFSCHASNPGHPHVSLYILSGLAVRHGDVWLTMPSSKPGAVLATLLLRANQVVSTGTLTEILWGARPPLTAAAALQNHVMRLRRRLGSCVGRRIKTVPPGYLAEVHDGELDLQRFTRLRDNGRAAGQRGGWAQAASDLTRALELFGRGPGLAEVDALGLHLPDVPELVEQGLQTLEWRIDADLCLGRHMETVAELRRITSMHPFRERFHEQLMVALVRSGRQAEALSAYQEARRVIVDELGVEPGRALRELHHRIIVADPALHDRVEPPPWARTGAPTRGPVRLSRLPPVAQLPVDLADFTGRIALSADLARWIAQAHDGHLGRAQIGAVTGPAGAGKTTLAVHVAHLASGQFPDGQLYSDLRGGDPRPAASSDVLARFLRDLGGGRRAAWARPVGDEELQTAYRSLLAGRRLLVVLDNARDAAQVRPLLPGTGACAVLITSRGSLAGLDGVRVLELGMLDDAGALALLGRIAGSARVEAEPDAAQDLLRACAGLPLAIRIAGSRLAARPSWSIRWFADRLADQRTRLDELRSGDRAVRGSFAVSYQGLPRSVGGHDADAAHVFRVLGTWAGPSLSLHAAAAMLGRRPRAVWASLEELVDAHLIESVGPARYRFHDLLRAYASERARAEDDPENLSEALDRLVTWYLHTAIAAIHTITPRPSDLPPIPARPSCRPLAFPAAAAALDWLDSERENLVSATTAAADSTLPAAWQLPVFLAVYFQLRGHFADWITTHEAGLAAARRACDRAGQAWLHGAPEAALRNREEQQRRRGLPADGLPHLASAAGVPGGHSRGSACRGYHRPQPARAHRRAGHCDAYGTTYAPSVASAAGVPKLRHSRWVRPPSRGSATRTAATGKNAAGPV
jgi:DNA-binding SARP family transcriptional activator